MSRTPPRRIANSRIGLAARLARGGWGWLGIGLLSSGIMASIATVVGVWALPQFTSMFAGSGVPLPPLTRWFAQGYLLAWLAPVVVLAMWYFAPGGAWARPMAAAIGLLATLVGAVIVVFALYLPYFQLGAVVG